MKRIRLIIMLMLGVLLLLSGCASASGVNKDESASEPAYEVTLKPGVYELSTESITVDITNTSAVDGGFARHYRIEQQTDGNWTTLPLEIIVTEDWILLPAGETQAHAYNLLQDQFDYRPGTYRVVLLGVDGEPSVEFELE